MGFFAKDFSIERVFEITNYVDDKKVFTVPYNQRNFVWEPDEHLQMLLEDILLSMNKTKTMFLGALVFSKEPMEPMVSTDNDCINIDVLDGQQRLTILTLTLALIYRFAKRKRKEFSEDCSDDVKERINDYYDRKIGRINTTLRVFHSGKYEIVLQVPRIYRNFYNDLVDDIIKKYDEGLDDVLNGIIGQYETSMQQIDSYHKILASVKKIYEFLENNIYSYDDLEDFVNFLTEKVHLVVITTDSFNQGFSVFRALNGSGEELKPEDFIKNFIMSKVSQNNTALYGRIDSKWNTFVENLKISSAKYHTQPVDFFELLLLCHQQDVSGDEIYSTFVTLVNNQTIDMSSDTKIESYMELLIQKSAFLKQQKSSLHSTLDKTGYKRLVYAPIMALFSQKNHTDFNKYVEQIGRYGFVLLVRGQTKNMRVHTIALINQIQDMNFNFNTLKSFIDNKFSQDGNDFKDRLKSLRVKRSGDALNKMKYMFAVMNKQLGGYVTPQDNVDLEHILPWTSNSNCLFDGNINDYEIYKKKIGNCTDVDASYNRSISNSCFAQKKISFQSPTLSPMTKSVGFDSITTAVPSVPAKYRNAIIAFNYTRQPSEDWLMDDIDNRTDVLCQFAEYIWINGNFVN